MCSYCGCDAIECIGRFMREHEAVVNALGVVQRACASGEQIAVTEATSALAGLLAPHTHAEEVGIFHVLREDEEFTPTIDKLCAEHVHIDALVARIAAGELAAYPQLEHVLREHIDHEDNGLFPAAAIRLAGPEWERVHELTPPAPA